MHNNTLTLSPSVYALLQNLNCALIKLSTELTIQNFNREAEIIYNCEEKAAINKNFIEFCKKNHIPPPIDDFSEVLAGKEISNISQIISINQTIKHLQWTILPLFEPYKSEISSILLTIINKDIRLKTESIVKKIEYFEHIINNVPHYLFWKDKNSVFLGCNERFATSAGLKSAEEIIGKTDYDLPWSVQESDAYRIDDQQIIQSKIAKINIEENQTINGKQIVLLTSKVPLFDEQKKVSGVLGIYTDITERKQMEEALRQEKEKAEAANRAKTIFFSQHQS